MTGTKILPHLSLLQRPLTGFVARSVVASTSDPLQPDGRSPVLLAARSNRCRVQPCSSPPFADHTRVVLVPLALRGRRHGGRLPTSARPLVRCARRRSHGSAARSLRPGLARAGSRRFRLHRPGRRASGSGGARPGCTGRLQSGDGGGLAGSRPERDGARNLRALGRRSGPYGGGRHRHAPRRADAQEWQGGGQERREISRVHVITVPCAVAARGADTAGVARTRTRTGKSGAPAGPWGPNT
jgi:hypothetical protein